LVISPGSEGLACSDRSRLFIRTVETSHVLRAIGLSAKTPASIRAASARHTPHKKYRRSRIVPRCCSATPRTIPAYQKIFLLACATLGWLCGRRAKSRRLVFLAFLAKYLKIQRHKAAAKAGDAAQSHGTLFASGRFRGRHHREHRASRADPVILPEEQKNWKWLGTPWSEFETRHNIKNTMPRTGKSDVTIPDRSHNTHPGQDRSAQTAKGSIDDVGPETIG